MHICGASEICTKCFQPMVNEDGGGSAREEHLCSWTKMKCPSSMTNIAIVQFQTAPVGNASCFMCFEKEKNQSGERCFYHVGEKIEGQDKPVICTMIFEDDRHENFQTACFLNPSLNIDQTQTEQKFPELPSYIPTELKNLYLENLDLDKKKPTFRFNKPARHDKVLAAKVHQLANKSDKDALYLFLEFVLQEKFENFFFLLETFEQMHQLMVALIENEISPQKVLRRRGKTMKFQIPLFNLTFVCSKVYVDNDVWEMEENKSQFTFFPLMLLNWSHWVTCEDTPPLECFIDLQDPNKLIQLKKKFWEKCHLRKWNSVQQLIDSSRSSLYTLAKSVLSYLNINLEFQVDMTWSFPANGSIFLILFYRCRASKCLENQRICKRTIFPFFIPSFLRRQPHTFSTRLDSLRKRENLEF